MAGAGGGPPRKSHTKSRKGCKTCKRRHIRCDENFPQCRNCTRHNCRCDYMDAPAPAAEESSNTPTGPNLLWTPQIEREIDLWQQTGVFPFPELGLRSFDQFRNLSSVDLRLIHHLSSIYQDMQSIDFVHCTLWANEIPKYVPDLRLRSEDSVDDVSTSFLDAALGFDFVMSSVLAFSATQLAWLTNVTENKNLALYHRGVALRGLHVAIGQFSRENSDAVLAASILLSWQAVEWGDWTSLMRGISTLVRSMESWKHESRFALYIDSHPKFLAGTPIQPSPLPFDHESLLLATDALQRLSASPPRSQTLRRCLAQVSDFTREVQSLGATLRSEQVFEKLQLLRSWLFWLPITLIHSDRIDDSDLILLAQVYTVALGVDAAFPELGGAALGSLTADAIEQIDSKLRYRQSSRSTRNQNPAELEELMQCARLMLTRFRLESTAAQSDPQLQLPGAQSPYGFQHLSLSSRPGTPGFMPGTPAGYPSGLPGTFSMIPNVSLEELSNPASPFLQYSTPASPRVSQHFERSPRPEDLSFDNRSLSAFSFGGESPAYSPGYLEEEPMFPYGGNSPGYGGGYHQ